MPKIVHFREDCIGCNSCVEHCPAYWMMVAADGKSKLKESKTKKDTDVLAVSDFEIEQNKLAAADCPVSIIRLLDDQGNEINPHQ